MRTASPFALCALAGLLLTAPLPGQEAAPKGTAKPAAPGAAAEESLTETHHSVTLHGTKLEYTATAGTLPLRDDEGKTKAHVFFIAYTKGQGPKDAAARRPVTFAFNGGPGSSSVWLHLGALGPRRVVLRPPGQGPEPPYRLVDNEATLLDLTDLVFIDPVTTGYSRAAKGDKPAQFHGVQEDLQSVADFIRLYTTRYRRWDAPKFLAGESYGTTRAAGLAGVLQDRIGMDLNGIILVSSVLNFGTIRFDEGNDLPFVLFLPSYTATAWYHKKLAADLQADRDRALTEAEKFAEGEYATALLKGDDLPAAERDRVARRLARLTGLSEAYVKRGNLRVEMSRFAKELLRGERRTVGRYDSRYTGTDLDAAGERPEYDPSYAAVQGPFTAAVNEYLRAELKYKSDSPYRVLTGRVMPWNFGTARNRYLNVSPSLRRALSENRGLRVFVASGRYDLATPYLATRYTVNHLGLEPGLRGHVTLADYDAGHMMYIDPGSLTKLKKDLTAFIHKALAEIRGEAGEANGRGGR